MHPNMQTGAIENIVILPAWVGYWVGYWVGAWVCCVNVAEGRSYSTFNVLTQRLRAISVLILNFEFPLQLEQSIFVVVLTKITQDIYSIPITKHLFCESYRCVIEPSARLVDSSTGFKRQYQRESIGRCAAGRRNAMVNRLHCEASSNFTAIRGYHWPRFPPFQTPGHWNLGAW